MGEGPQRMVVSASSSSATQHAAAGGNKQHEETLQVLEEQPQDGGGSSSSSNSRTRPLEQQTSSQTATEDDTSTETVSQESEDTTTSSARTATTANTDPYSSSTCNEEEEEDEDHHDAHDSHDEQQQQQAEHYEDEDELEATAASAASAFETAVEWKVEGNAAFSNKNYQQALEAYQRGLEALAAVVVMHLNQQYQHPQYHHLPPPPVRNHHGNDHDGSATSISTSTSSSNLLLPQIQELKINLYANCAMALIRLQQYQQAEQVCTNVLKDCYNNTKIWYRRALARQGQASTLLAAPSSSATNKTAAAAAARELLLAAKSDLRQALALVDEQLAASTLCSTTTKERDGLKKTVAALAQQVQSHLQQLHVNDDSSTPRPAQTTTMQNHIVAASNNIITAATASTTSTSIGNGAFPGGPAGTIINNSVVATAVVVTPYPHCYPEPAKQRHDIIRLLLARQVGLKQHAADATALPGEGFFLVDAHWWTRFCQHVDLFYFKSNSNNKNGIKNGAAGITTPPTTSHTTAAPILGPTQTKVLGYLPPGAILPEIYDDSDNDSSDSDDDEDMVHNHHEAPPPPGPIDNTRLLLLPPRRQGNEGTVTRATTTCKTRQIFLRHWYRRRPLLNTMHPPSASISSSSSSCFPNNDNATTNDGALPQQQQQLPKQQPALCPSLVRGYHYEILPREVYSALRQWYGEATPSLCRRATILNNTSSAAAESGDGAAAARIGVPLYPNANITAPPPCFHLPDNHHEVPPPQTSCGACRAPRVGLRCTRCSVVYYCDRTCQESHWPLHKNECRTIQQYKQQVLEQRQQEESSTMTATLPLPAEFLPTSDGRVGLNNLGNTCFMNSALQCLSHSTPLTRLFLSGNFRLDVNQSNPLGSGGKLGHAYEAVMKELWMRDEFGATSAAMRRRKSTSPTALKRAIALFAPRFAGHLQHDAQEFLAYLLDGLHEDLNRIRQAPYVEMPDVTDGQNMHVAGARAWDAHRRRNDSLVMDTFYGQFKSTCVCPRCNRVSVSFDAFNHVSLEIPQHNAIVPVGVVVCRAPTGNAAMVKPVRYSVQMRRDSPISDLKQEVSKLCGIPVLHLHFCQVMEQEIVSIYRENQLVSSVKNLTVAYQAEPFSNAAFASFHVLTKHKLVTTSLTAAIAAAEENNDEAALAAAVASSDNDFMGIPILTSFPADLTCRQVFQHFWELVQDKLPDGEMKQPKDMLQLRMHNGQGQPVALFPNLGAAAATSAPDAEEGKELEQQEKSGRTSLIPKDLDEPVVRFLGEAAIDTFHSVWIEWNVTICEDNDCNIDANRFSSVNNHSSWCEAEERLRTSVSRGVTLDQCFETFTKPERLDERNMWYCSKCKEHVRAMKTMELWRLPNVLIVHLKRFEFKNVLRRDKLDMLVDFPLEGLDMSNHCASDRDINFVDQTVPAVYDLFAVTNHYGRMGFGHYTAFAREWSEDGISDDWALFDDSSARSVGDGTDSVVSPAAYVLFYRRRTFS